MELSRETYGALKVACEIEASRAFPARCLTIRPGYLVGPHDPTERFVKYVRRASSGGEMFAPGPPGAPFQLLDVRDLASFALDRIEVRERETYGAVGEQRTMLATLETIRDVTAAETSFVWAPHDLLECLGEDVSRWFPMWDTHPGAHTYDASKAVRAGLRHRPLSETVNDTLSWDRDRGTPELPSALRRDQEQELIAASRPRVTS